MRTSKGLALIYQRATRRRHGDARGGRRGGVDPGRSDPLRRAGGRCSRCAPGGVADRRPRRHDHARAGRGPFPSHLLQRRRARRPRHQVPGRVRHAAGGGQRPAGARVRLHGGAQRRQPVQHRRLAEEGHRRGSCPRPAPGRQRARDLRRRRADGLEPRVPQDRHGRAGAADQRPGRRPRRGAQAGQGRRRVGQDLSHRRRRRPRHERPSHAVHDLRGDARRGRRGAQYHQQSHRPLPRDRRHQERPARRLRSHRARHVHGRRGARHAAGAQYAVSSPRCSSSRPASSTARSSACRRP